MRRGDEKKQAFLDVAERLFYHKGFEHTSIQDILSVLSASKGSFYHHFESKFTVLEMLCEQRADKLLEKAQEAAGGQTHGLHRLCTLLYYAMALRGGEERFMAMLLPMMFTDQGVTLQSRYSLALKQAFKPAMDSALTQAAGEGEIHLYHPDYAADMLLALVNQCWYDIARMIMDAKYQNRMVDEGTLLSLLQAYRFSMERLLDAPYGCLDIIRLPELMEAVSRILTEIRLN